MTAPQTAFISIRTSNSRTLQGVGSPCFLTGSVMPSICCLHIFMHKSWHLAADVTSCLNSFECKTIEQS